VAIAKRHYYLPEKIRHTPVKYACPVQSSIRFPLSGIPQGRHLPEVESKGFVKETILGSKTKI
jgi:hypothetical protein